MESYSRSGEIRVLIPKYPGVLPPMREMKVSLNTILSLFSSRHIKMPTSGVDIFSIVDSVFSLF